MNPGVPENANGVVRTGG